MLSKCFRRKKKRMNNKNIQMWGIWNENDGYWGFFLNKNIADAECEDLNDIYDMLRYSVIEIEFMDR